ncbi:MAG: glycoside hydrolase family 3 C-terminal domain-containing protein [Pseudobutyrivibrio sp.]|nr:glycoside hydrolase family 3 C-terminal domain-containing protein [Pseudobutyrivibrio sp.]
MSARDILTKLTLEEKAALLSGKNEWESRDLPSKGIKSITFSDGPHGLRRQLDGNGDHLGLGSSLPATCFPTAATVANSWDESLGEKVGQALGEEAKVQKVNVLLGPGLNIKRSPLCGRNFEYFSEDPYLAGKMAASYIRGIQSQGVYACPKHFAVNSREYRRMAMNAVVDEQTLREIYLTGFEIAVKEGGAKAIMSSYNEVNGEYANENKHLLVDILRKEWGFDGIVVTDWGASNDHVEGVRCQSNVEMPNPGLDSARELVEAVKIGRISEAELDEAIVPILEALEHFEANPRVAEEFDKEAHHAIAREVASKSAVLLRNEDDILPLKSGTKVALRGPFVDKPRYQGAGSSQVNSTKLETIGDQIANYNLTVVNEVREADVVLFFFGLDEIAESEGADRFSMDIPEYQIKELDELYKAGAKIVGVMSAGSAVKMPWLNHLKGLLHGYLTGQAGAGAILDILTGKINPSGKLAESYPFSYADCSIEHFDGTETRNLEYREGIYVGYRYYEKEEMPVQFPFGFGLSYTTFEYSNLVVSEEGVSFDITNKGSVAGSEIAQLYIGRSGETKVIRPVKELKGFAKVSLEPGETKNVKIAFDDKSFRYFNIATDSFETEAGEYEIFVGSSSADIRLKGTITKSGTTEVVPYDLSKLPSYVTGHIRNVHRDEFAKLYGRALPEEKTGPLEINDALCQMKDAKSGLCRLVYKVLKRNMDKSYEAGVPDLNVLFIYNMPFRAMHKMSGGMVSRQMTESIVVIANGHFFKGLGGVISGFFKNQKLNKEYERRLK